ncbi:hypothetical protein Hanom_Chr11g01021851 [Helianthus anomalus]
MMLYAFYFKDGNFRLPMMKFFGEVLSRYGLHISQINALGLPPVTHFKFILRSQQLIPLVDMFNFFTTFHIPAVSIHSTFELPTFFLTFMLIVKECRRC